MVNTLWTSACFAENGYVIISGILTNAKEPYLHDYKIIQNDRHILIDLHKCLNITPSAAPNINGKFTSLSNKHIVAKGIVFNYIEYMNSIDAFSATIDPKKNSCENIVYFLVTSAEVAN